MKPGGIYAIECSANAKVYIGSAKDLQSRQKEHIAKLSNGTHFNPYLQRAWNKHGANAFEFKTIKFLGSYCKDNYFSAENDAMREFRNSGIQLFNVAMAGGGGWGPDISDERRAEIGLKISEGVKKFHASLTDKQRIEIYGHLKGKPLSLDRRLALSKFWEGKPKSDSTILKMCIAQSKENEGRKIRMSSVGKGRLGITPANARPVEINGQNFSSCGHAAKTLGLSHRLVSKIAKEQKHGAN